MFGTDLLHEWTGVGQPGGATLGSATYTGSTVNGVAIDVSDGQTLTNAVINLFSPGSDSPTFQLQESADTISGHFTNITDSNASIACNSGAGVYVINGQRQYSFARVQMTPSTGSDTIGVSAVIMDIRTQMPLGSTGSSISPA